MIAIIVIAAVVVVGGLISAGPLTFLSSPSVGSGNVVTRQENFTGFTAVKISNGFRFTITQSGTYGVKVTTDDNLANYVQVSQAGNTLSVGLAFGRNYQPTTLRVEITMPDISQLDISQGTGGTVTGFNLSHDFTVTASQGSEANIGGSARDLSVDASSGSQLDLSGFHVANAQVTLSQGSGATISLDGRLDASLSEGSQLYYLGNPTMGNISTTGGSSISKR
jgi:hypothetical protein